MRIKLLISSRKGLGAPEIPVGRRRYKYLPQGRIIVHIFWASRSNLMVMVYYAMFKYIAVANVNPSISFKMELILSIGKDVRSMCLFSSLKFVRNRTVWSNFGLINVGELHFCFTKVRVG